MGLNLLERTAFAMSLKTFVLFCIFAALPHLSYPTPINRQAGISENVFITLQNDTYGVEQRVCSIDSMTYVDGDSIPTSSPCEHCICRPPGFACTIISCEYRPGCKALRRSNQCCPEYQCECEKDGKIYQNGEKILDNNNPCEVCYCQGGEVICAVIDCYWRSDCQPRYIENRCCPLYDHCPQNTMQMHGPIRPTQAPLPTMSTFSWFNLSSAIQETSPTTTTSPKTTTTTTTPTTTTTTPKSTTTAAPETEPEPEPISNQLVEDVAPPPKEAEEKPEESPVVSIPVIESSSVIEVIPKETIIIPPALEIVVLNSSPVSEQEQLLTTVSMISPEVDGEIHEINDPLPTEIENENEKEFVLSPSISAVEAFNLVENSVEPTESIPQVQDQTSSSESPIEATHINEIIPTVTILPTTTVDHPDVTEVPDIVQEFNIELDKTPEISAQNDIHENIEVEREPVHAFVKTPADNPTEVQEVVEQVENVVENNVVPSVPIVEKTADIEANEISDIPVPSIELQPPRPDPVVAFVIAPVVAETTLVEEVAVSSKAPEAQTTTENVEIQTTEKPSIVQNEVNIPPPVDISSSIQVVDEKINEEVTITTTVGPTEAEKSPEIAEVYLHGTGEAAVDGIKVEEIVPVTEAEAEISTTTRPLETVVENEEVVVSLVQPEEPEVHQEKELIKSPLESPAVDEVPQITTVLPEISDDFQALAEKQVVEEKEMEFVKSSAESHDDIQIQTTQSLVENGNEVEATTQAVEIEIVDDSPAISPILKSHSQVHESETKVNIEPVGDNEHEVNDEVEVHDEKVTTTKPISNDETVEIEIENALNEIQNDESQVQIQTTQLPPVVAEKFEIFHDAIPDPDDKEIQITTQLPTVQAEKEGNIESENEILQDDVEHNTEKTVVDDEESKFRIDSSIFSDVDSDDEIPKTTFSPIVPVERHEVDEVKVKPHSEKENEVVFDDILNAQPEPEIEKTTVSNQFRTLDDLLEIESENQIVTEKITSPAHLVQEKNEDSQDDIATEVPVVDQVVDEEINSLSRHHHPDHHEEEEVAGTTTSELPSVRHHHPDHHEPHEVEEESVGITTSEAPSVRHHHPDHHEPDVEESIGTTSETPSVRHHHPEHHEPDVEESIGTTSEPPSLRHHHPDHHENEETTISNTVQSDDNVDENDEVGDEKIPSKEEVIVTREEIYRDESEVPKTESPVDEVELTTVSSPENVKSPENAQNVLKSDIARPVVISEDMDMVGKYRTGLGPDVPHSIETGMQNEMDSTDETWLWRMFNRLRTLPDIFPRSRSARTETSDKDEADDWKKFILKSKKKASAADVLEKKNRRPHYKLGSLNA